MTAVLNNGRRRRACKAVEVFHPGRKSLKTSKSKRPSPEGEVTAQSTQATVRSSKIREKNLKPVFKER